MDVCGVLVFILIVDAALEDHRTKKKVINAFRLMVGFDIVALNSDIALALTV
jgi:hypothetical protein